MRADFKLRGDTERRRRIAVRRLPAAAVTLVLTLAALAALPAAAPTASASSGGVTATGPRLSVTAARVVNYYPATGGWTRMWQSYSHARTDADFAQIAVLHANTVRLIVQATPDGVGYPRVGAVCAAELADMIALAGRHGLYVQLTLFDWFSSYTDVSGSKNWAAGLLAPYRNDHRIAIVELQNEINPANAAAMTWARGMLPYLKSLLPGTPRTLDVAGSAPPAQVRSLFTQIPASDLDVVDVHLYGHWSAIKNTLAAATQVAGGRPVIIGEAGWSDGEETVGADEAQKAFFAKLATLAASLGLPPPAPWTLNDFTADAIPGGAPAAEYTYGLRRTDGTWKPAAQTVTQMFSGTPTGLEIDGTFANEDPEFEATTHTFGAWQAYHADQVDRMEISSGEAVLDGAHGDDSGCPAFVQEVPLLSGDQVTLAATVHVGGGAGATSATGTSAIAMAWFDLDGEYLGQTESDARNTSEVQRLSVTAVPPPGAAVVQLHLKACGNVGATTFSAVTYTLAG